MRLQWQISRPKLFTKAGWLEIQPWLEELDTWLVKCSLSLSSPLSSRCFFIFLWRFLWPLCTYSTKEKCHTLYSCKKWYRNQARFAYSTDRFVIRIHNWHFNSFWIQPCNALSQASRVLHTSFHPLCRPSSILHLRLQLTTLHLSTTIGLKLKSTKQLL